MTIRAVSYGGGVQSTALLVLAAQGKIDFPLFLMANVGDDSEHPATLTYVRDVATPYAETHGIELVMLDRVMRDGTTRTLYEDLTRASRTINIPVRMANGAPGRRNCTHTYKMQVTGRWLREHGATKDDPATVAIGISCDEIERANNRRAEPHERIVYPLLDLRMRRDDCQRVIREAGLPVPGKSACWFCPFHRPSAWADMRRNEPDLFERSADLEALLNARRDELGKDHVYLTRFAKPLSEAIAGPEHMVLFDSDDNGTCDSGWCMT